jgi:phosphoglycerol transferase MdoB-like AlkP superfamily enzyme
MKNVVKRFCFVLLSLLFLETVFSFVIFNGITIDKVINVFLYSVIITSLLCILTGIFNNKANNVIMAIILFIIGIMFSVQLVFYNVYKVFASFSMLGLTDQIAGFMGEAVTAIKDNILYIIIMLVPFIIFLIFKKRINLEKNQLKNYLVYLIIMILSIGLYIFYMAKTQDNENSTYYLYHDVNNISLNIEKLGVNNSYLVDIYRAIFGFEEDIIQEIDVDVIKEDEEIPEVIYEKNTINLSFDKKTNNSDIKKINDYMKSITGTDKNEYTGKYSGYNLVYIVAESFSEIAVREDITPTLYRLTHSGFMFDNYYTPNTLSTIGGEFQALTGLYPDSSILSTWRKGKNYFPYGLATVFKNLGYKTYAYHNNWYGFQDRHKYLKSQGFTNYIGCSNGMEKRMNCNRWPASDLEMIKVTMKDYINNDEPFLAYYMTVSGHFQYNFSDNSMASKNKSKVNKLKYNTSAKAYLATQIELDKALEYLINKLDEAGKLDNTIIVLLADHYPYKLDMKTINSLSSYKRDSVVEVNHNNLILWNNTMEDVHIEKVCMSSDVIPTIYNLFGVEYDSRLFTGRDILSTEDGLAVFSNRSFRSDVGTYFTSGSKFVGEDINGYVANMKNVVKNRLNVAKLIIKTDYYKYLFK